MKKLKVVYVSGSRADYSLMRRTLIKLARKVDLTIITTCMHLSKKFGYTIREIEKDRLKTKRVKMPLDKDTLEAMVESFGIGISGIAKTIKKISPDIVFVEADRGEALAGAIAGSHLNIKVLHHGGGDLSKSIDNKIRYAITMFSDYHLAGNEESYQRLLRIGIPREKIFKVGEPGLDDIYEKDFTSQEEIAKKYKLNLKKPSLILAQYPNTEEHGDVKKQIRETLEAVKNLKIQTVAVYSNSDAGGRAINKTLEKYARNLPFFRVYPSIERRDFLGLMNVCDAILGNSTTGIVELPSFKKPFICIGTRQKNRLRAGNTIEAGYNKDSIIKAIKKALYDKKFQKKLSKIRNPYGDGKSSERIVRIILKIGQKL